MCTSHGCSLPRGGGAHAVIVLSVAPSHTLGGVRSGAGPLRRVRSHRRRRQRVCDITVVNRFPSKEQAEAFAADPSLKEAMDRGGVISEPRLTWAQEGEAVDYVAKAA